MLGKEGVSRQASSNVDTVHGQGGGKAAGQRQQKGWSRSMHMHSHSDGVYLAEPIPMSFMFDIDDEWTVMRERSKSKHWVGEMHG